MTKKWRLGQVIKIILLVLPLAALSYCYISCTITDMEFKSAQREARERLPEIRVELEECINAIVPTLRADMRVQSANRYLSVEEQEPYIDIRTLEGIEKWRAKYGDEPADALKKFMELGLHIFSLEDYDKGVITLRLKNSDSAPWWMWYEFAVDGSVIVAENGPGVEILGDDWYLVYMYKS